MGRARLFLVVAVLSGVASVVLVRSAMSWDAESRQQLRHVVLFKFKPEVDQQQIDQIVQEFTELQRKIDAIVDFEWGENVSVEEHSQGFTHCFLVTFADERGRDAYLPHPAHQAFAELVKPKLAGVLVVDYWNRP